MVGTKESRVFKALRSQLILGEWQPNARLHTAHLAETLGVSLSPIRESLIRLTERGLVRNENRLGFVVVDHNPVFTEAYCCLLAELYESSIQRVATAGMFGAVAEGLQTSLAALPTEQRSAQAYLEATAACRRVLIITPYLHIAEQLDDYAAAHAAHTIASDHFYDARLREIAALADGLPNCTPSRLIRAIRLYYTRRATEITRASARLAGLPARPNPEHYRPQKSRLGDA